MAARTPSAKSGWAIDCNSAVSPTSNSDENWASALPDDLVYDTTAENFTIVTDELEPGEHIIAVRIADDFDNIAYKTFAVEVK